MEQDEVDVVMWSGGKDCALATILYQNSLATADKRRLVFVTTIEIAAFRVPGLQTTTTDANLILQHGRAFGAISELAVIPHNNSNCSTKTYNLLFRYLKSRYKIRNVIRGDIFDDENAKSVPPTNCFARSLSETNIGCTIVHPLMGLFTEELFSSLEDWGVHAKITSVSKTCYFDLLEKDISLELLTRVGLANKTNFPNFDHMGEHGEYQTAVTQIGTRKFRMSEYELYAGANCLTFNAYSPFKQVEGCSGFELNFVDVMTVGSYDPKQPSILNIESQ